VNLSGLWGPPHRCNAKRSGEYPVNGHRQRSQSTVLPSLGLEAGNGAVTLSNVEIFDQNWRALQLESLVDLSLWAGGFHPIGELLEEVLRRAVGNLDASMGKSVALDEQGRERLSRSIGFPEDAGGFEDIFGSNAALVFRNPGKVGISGRLQRPHEVIAAPLRWRERLLGYILLGDKESREGSPAFSDSDARYLQTLATVISGAMATSLHLEDIEKQRLQLEEENRSLRDLGRSEGFIGSSPPVSKMLELIARVAPTEVSIMLRGESGSGKERVARLIHSSSGRAHAPMIAINCAALPETLLEAELFGIEEGVATGVRKRPGKLELARGGTLFLDEIGDLSLPLQAKLLRVVQEREFERLGGRESLPFDARLITATHCNLEEMIRKGLFRSDLYYRLRVVVIELPPLRERPTDIRLLTRHFLRKFSDEFGRGDLRISREAMRALEVWPFPGNVRELENRIQAAVAMAAEHEEIGVEDLGLQRESAPPTFPAEARRLEEVEKAHILKILEQTGGNRSRAAEILGINRATLYRKLRRFASQDA